MSSILSRVRTAWTVLTKGTVADRDLSSLLQYGPTFLPYTAAWTDNRVEQCRHFKTWTFVAIDRIARNIAKRFPNISYVRVEGRDEHSKLYDLQTGRPRFIHAGLRQKALTPLLTHEQLEPVPYNHPLYRLFVDPNEPDSYYDLIYETILYLCLTGTAYWWTPKNDFTGLPVAAWCIPSQWMWPVFDRQKLISGWEIRPIEGNYLKKILPADEVIVFRTKNPISKIDGYSPLAAGSQWIDTSESIDRARMYAYRNGTFPTVAVQFDGKLLDPSDTDLVRIEQKFIARMVGETRSNKPLFLPPGVTVKPLVIKPNEMIFGESATQMRDNILALFGVPAVIAGIRDVTSSGDLPAQEACFHSLTLNNWWTFLASVINEKLCRLYGPNVRAWWEDSTPPDPQLIEKQIQTDVMCGAITTNEVRALRGHEPYGWEWANRPLMPVNMTTIDPTTGPMGGTHSTNPAGGPDNPSEPAVPHPSDET